jgi:hypothetical protein
VRYIAGSVWLGAAAVALDLHPALGFQGGQHFLDQL